MAEAAFPTEFGDFKIVVFENLLDQDHHIALVKGEVASDEPVMVRVHSQSTVDDVFYSLRSGGHNELRSALKSYPGRQAKAFWFTSGRKTRAATSSTKSNPMPCRMPVRILLTKSRHCFRH